MKYYILKDKEPVIVSFTEYAQWHENADRHVDSTYIGNIHVSTVFLGIDHKFLKDNVGSPVLFETMIFNGMHDGYQRRCCTWDEAVKLHQEALGLIMLTPKYKRIIKQFISWINSLK